MPALPTPPAGWLLTLDVGRAQGRIDVPALVAAGVSALCIRATDGEHDVDPEFERTAAACVAEGLDFGCYFVLEAYGPKRAEGQGRHFAEVTKASGATLPGWIDFELAHGLSGLDALRSAVIVRDFLRGELGGELVLYTGPSFVETLERYAGHAGDPVVASLGSSPLAVAHYTQSVETLPSVPPPWDDWLYWQASGDAKASRNFATLPGRSTVVDVDFPRATLDELRALGPSSST
jgi:lysozyme